MSAYPSEREGSVSSSAIRTGPHGGRSPLAIGGLVLAVGMLAALPLLGLSGYALTVLNLAGVQTIAVLGFYLILGLTGQLNLAQASFFGVGAYTTGLLTVKLHWPMTLSVPVALALCALAGVVLGLPSFKLRGHYLAIATLGFSIIFELILRNWVDVTNGADGVPGIPLPAPLGLRLTNKAHYYYLVLTCVVLAVALAHWITHSRLGLALQAIREDEIAAGASGVNVWLYKVLAFVLCAVYAGFAGVLYAHMVRYVSPGDFTLDKSFTFLIMLVLGGRTSLAGAVIGAAVVTVLPEWLRVLENYHRVVFGLSVLVMMVFTPSGIAGGLEALVRRLARGLRLDRRSSHAAYLGG